jgi:hypothetical protein
VSGLGGLVPPAVRFLQSRENLPVTAPATERLPADGDGNAALVPEAEPLVKPFRDRYDPSAAAGVPAHITLLYPFKHPDEADQTVLGDLNQCFHVHRFGSLSHRSGDSPTPFCVLPQSQTNPSVN